MKKSILLLGALLATCVHAANVYVLSDFSNFTPSFYDPFSSWSSATAQSGPTSFTIADFGAGTPKNDGVFYVNLGAAQDFSAYDTITFSGSVFTGNATTQVSFFFEDINANGGVATFNISALSGGPVSLNLGGLFSQIDQTQVKLWGFTTQNQFDGSKNFAVTFDEVKLSTTVVPEPATYAAIFGGLALTAAIYRRQRRRE